MLYVTEESNVSSIIQNPARWKHFTNILLIPVPKQCLTIDLRVILTFIGYNHTWWYHRLPLWQSTAHLFAISLFVQLVWFPGIEVELQVLHLVEEIPFFTLLTQSVTERVNDCFVNKQQSVPALIFHHIFHWMQYWHISKTAIWGSYNNWAQKHKNYIRQHPHIS